MLRCKYINKIVLFFLLFNCCETYKSFAHEGHDHLHDTRAATIERSTYTYFKSILSTYHEVYDNLIKKEVSHLPVLALILLDSADKGILTESKGSGYHMMHHILEGAQKLSLAEGLQEAQEAFASISDAVLPFFRSWPNQLNINRLKIFECKEHGLYWLQPHDHSPACPYAFNETVKCSYIVEEMANKRGNYVKP